MHLNRVGAVVKTVWENLPHHFPLIQLDAFVLMSNHVHGIIVIADSAGNCNPNPNCRDVSEAMPEALAFVPGFKDTSLPRGTQSGSIGAILQSFKSVATRRVNRITQNSGTLWQRNYHEEVIRNEKAYENIRRYIIENLLSWDEDEENLLKFKPQY